MSDNDEFIREFLDESSENLDLLDQDFVALENNPDDPDRLANVFRTIHTIKGTSGFFNFSKLGAISHAGENLLGLLREGKLRLDQEIASALLQCVDSIREVLAEIDSTGGEGSGDYRELNERLSQLAKKQQDEAEVPETPGPTALAASIAQPEPIVEVETEPVVAVVAETVSSAAKASTPTSQPEPVVESQSPPESQSPLKTKSPLKAQSPPKPKARSASASSSSSVRVDVTMLDDLMTLVGELVLARNQLLQFSNAIEDRHYQGVTQRVNQITSDLQEGIMKTRMQPIGTMWSKFPRVVRDLAVNCRKEVRLVMEGQETELDRTLLEGIKDPLTHLIRNSIDHGIETPQQRRKLGKNPEGTLLLRSFHEGGLVNIEITDDGGGIDVVKVKDKAIAGGILTPEQSRQMTDDELVQLIFRPGFSTANEVTDVSGRGVGMDVVRTNIERIGGSIELKNRPGNGTTVSIKIPLTLAIIPAMMVCAGGQSFAVPQASVIELLSLSQGDPNKSIEYINQTPVFRLRGQLLPLVILQEQLELNQTSELQSRETVEVIVLQADQLRFGLVVDSISNSQEIVVKPLDPAIGALRVYSGATILGDGQVTLILDVTGIATKSISGSVMASVRDELSETENTDSGFEAEVRSVLVCGIDRETQVALPLDQVRRLEQIKTSEIERSTGGHVVQCRGAIIPIVDLASSLRQTASNLASVASPMIHVVVAGMSGNEVGFVVDRIVDVVSCPTANPTLESTTGVLGQAVINEQVTDIVDVAGLINRRGS